MIIVRTILHVSVHVSLVLHCSRIEQCCVLRAGWSHPINCPELPTSVHGQQQRCVAAPATSRGDAAQPATSAAPAHEAATAMHDVPHGAARSALTPATTPPGKLEASWQQQQRDGAAAPGAASDVRSTAGSRWEAPDLAAVAPPAALLSSSGVRGEDSAASARAPLTPWQTRQQCTAPADRPASASTGKKLPCSCCSPRPVLPAGRSKEH